MYFLCVCVCVTVCQLAPSALVYSGAKINLTRRGIKKREEEEEEETSQ